MEYIKITLLMLMFSEVAIVHSLDLGVACTLKSNCTATYADCLNKTCQCEPAYYQKSTLSCLMRLKVNETCIVSENSCIQTAECNITTLICQCRKGFKVTADKTCVSGAGHLRIKLMFAVLLASIFRVFF